MFGMWKNKRKRNRWIGHICVVGLAAVCILPVQAKAKMQIMQTAVDGDNLYLYIGGMEDETTATGQIAQNKAEVTDITARTDIHTIILLDNSLSITEQNKGKIRDALSSYFLQKEEAEQISIATYGEDIVYLAERETDQEKLMSALDEVTYANQDSFLTDILYDAIENMKEECGYTRFIVAADGVDNKAIGYTKEELQTLLAGKNYPIYALGCVYKNNAEELENFFSLARLTKAEYFLLDDYEDMSEIVTAFSGSVTCVTMEIPVECRDGGEKNVLLSLGEEGAVTELTSKAVMPFQIREPEPEPEPEPEIESVVVEPEPQPESESESEPVVVEPEPQPEPEEDKAGIDPVTLVAVIVIVGAVILLLLQTKGKKKEKRKEKRKEEKPKEKAAETIEGKVAEFQAVSEPIEADDGRTMILPRNSKGYIVVLRDQKNPDKVFRYPLTDRVVIGRKNEAGVNIVLNYDHSVSGRHCEITYYGDRFYIEDLNSTNKTFINGRAVEGKIEFKPGDVLTFGRLEMTIDIEKR